MFQYIFGKIDKFGWWYFEKVLEDAGTKFTSGGFQTRIPNLRCSFYVSSSVESGNERTGQSDKENVDINFTLTQCTCKSHISVYSFCIHVCNRSYFPLLPIKDLINKDGNPAMPLN